MSKKRLVLVLSIILGIVVLAVIQFVYRAISRCRRAEAHLNRGVMLAREGNLDGAIAEYREAIRLKPDFPEAYFNLGVAFGRKGNPSEAATAYREAIRLKPDYLEAHFNLGSTLAKNSDPDGAIPAFRQVLRLMPNLADAHSSLGIALGMKGELDEAISEFREAIRLNRDGPEARRAYHNLGLALIKKSQLDGALKEYREAALIWPGLPEPHFNLAWAYALEKDVEHAATSLHSAIELDQAYREKAREHEAFAPIRSHPAIVKLFGPPEE